MYYPSPHHIYSWVKLSMAARYLADDERKGGGMSVRAQLYTTTCGAIFSSMAIRWQIKASPKWYERAEASENRTALLRFFFTKKKLFSLTVSAVGT